MIHYLDLVRPFKGDSYEATKTVALLAMLAMVRSPKSELTREWVGLGFAAIGAFDALAAVRD